MGTSPSKRYSGSHLVTVKCYIQYLFLMVFYIQYISGSDVSFSSTIMEQLGSLVFLNHLVPNPGLGPLERERERGGGGCERGGVERICGTDTAVVRSIPIGNQRADKTLLVE